MQVSKIMLAVAALAIGTAAFAKPNDERIAISSGASATKNNLKVALTALCPGKLSEFTSGSNISTYVCHDTAASAALTAGTYTSKANTDFKNFTGTNFAELRLNVTGGSFTAVCALNNWPAGTACANVNTGGAADTYVDPATGGLVLPAANQVVVGGLMDVAPTAWPSDVTLGLTIPEVQSTGVAQTFGVAVTDALYTKLFNAQKNPVANGGVTVAYPIPNSCAEADTAKLECVPTVSKGQMATIMSGDEFDTAHAQGVKFLTGVAGDDSVTLEYHRRADTSGTQASAQVYFLNLPCGGASARTVAAAIDPSWDGTGIAPVSYDLGAVRVYHHAGTGDVRTGLNVAGSLGIGIMSGENKNTGTWKWVRVQGAAMGENSVPETAGVTNSASVTKGSYDFFFESVVAPGTANGAADFWTAVTGSLNTLTAPTGLLNASQLAGFNKGSDACKFNGSL